MSLRAYFPARRRGPLLGLAVVLAVAVGCGDSPSEPDAGTEREVGVVVNSQDHSLTVFVVDGTNGGFTVGAGPEGSPVTLAVRGETAVVPLGVVPAAAVVDLAARGLARTVALPEGSGATGVAFVNDSIAVVANPNLNSVSPINVRTGERAGSIDVGGFPQAVVAVADTAYVLNAELGADYQPAGPGTVSVLTGSPLEVVKTITLTGTNPGAAAAGADGRLYVVDAGRWGENEGSLSVIDRATLEEIDHHDGFGDFPGSIALDAAGRAYIGGFGIGLLVWDTHTGTFVRGPADPVAPGGVASVSGAGVDSDGRLYTLEPDCQGPSRVLRLSATYEVDDEFAVGTCPLGITFTVIPVPDA